MFDDVRFHDQVEADFFAEKCCIFLDLWYNRQNYAVLATADQEDYDHG